MCWKHEWAKAVNNINWALIHIERARIKVDKRGLKGAADLCEELMDDLKGTQEELKILIKDYGISKKRRSPTLQKHMKGQRRRAGKVQAWVQKN